MKENSGFVARKIMLDFADLTGLKPANTHPERYLWTDAFAVCNYLELFHQTTDKDYLNLAKDLVDLVHHTLGRHRADDPRTGWISGLNEELGRLHPIQGGLRIGKKLNERIPGEPVDERLEWDQDGQYYHYLTKWMHALSRLGQVTGDHNYVLWGIELAQTAHNAFSYTASDGGRRMYWKMSIDLTYPLVPSMGQHDPLDGFITYSELQIAAQYFEESMPDLGAEIADMTRVCQRMHWATNDPLGLGGLLFDASRITQLMIKGDLEYGNLLENILDSTLLGLESFKESNALEFPADYRLAFRELGLAIGLKGVVNLSRGIEENAGCFKKKSLHLQIEALQEYLPLAESIDQFWIDEKNQNISSWVEHREINMVMLATSLVPDGFLTI